MFVCPFCKSKVHFEREKASCISCKRVFEKVKGFWNFMENKPSFYVHEDILFQQEERGMKLRTERFYLPHIKKLFGDRKNLRILDSGCGTGRVVKELRKLNFQAFGIDVEATRGHLWDNPNSFFFADGRSLPFENEFFDIIISFGVLEHVGVEGGKIDKEQRRRYISESIRCLKRGGVLFISFPSGAFPIDFWHGGRWHMRFHLPFFDYTPNFWEMLKYFRNHSVEIKSLSPWEHLYFKTASGRWYRYFIPFAMAWFISLKGPWENIITRFFSPFLVLIIRKL